MLRCLLQNFPRSLTLQLTALPNKSWRTSKQLLPLALQQRSFIHIEESAPEKDIGDPNTAYVGSANESDTEYIKPYRTDYEEYVNHDEFVEVVKTRLNLTTADVKRLLTEDVVRGRKHRSMLWCLDRLCSAGVTKKCFIDYPWLITLDKSRLENKLTLLYSMNIRELNHFVAFLRLTMPRLRKLVGSLNLESNSIPHQNRVYYISEKLKTDPYVVTKFLSRRLFILEMPFDMLEQNLNHMIGYNVSPKNILNDLWAFRYTPKSVQLRLERARIAKKDKIMPWMVRCPEPILQRSLKLSLDELAVLGDKTSAVEYVAERLQFDPNEMKSIMERHPSTLRVRVPKIKEVLDYLINEAGFNRFEIAQVPRILCHGLKTTKKRIDELKTYGCRPTSLVILCRSKREYEKFLNYWISLHKKPNARTDDSTVAKNVEPQSNT